MSESLERGLDLEGAAAYPRRNGHPDFSAPWQSRAFGMAMALSEAGEIDWEEFRQSLIESVARDRRSAEPELGDEDGSLYYERWTDALVHLLTEHGLIGAKELRERAAEFRAGGRREVF